MAGKMINITAHDGGKFSGYLTLPDNGSGPGLIIGQEIFGINKTLRETADKFAEEGYVVLIPLAAVIFHSLGRHPLAGLAAAFAGVSGGYSANLLLGTVDPLLSGITQEAARIIDPAYIVGAEANWYFMIASTFLISGLGYFVTEKIVEPSLGEYNPKDADDASVLDTQIEKVSALEKKGLLWAGISMLIFCLLLAWTIIPADGILRNPETGLVSGSPFLKGIVVFIFVFFAIPGYIYGKITGSIKNNQDVVYQTLENPGPARPAGPE